LQFADISKELDTNVLTLILQDIYLFLCTSTVNEDGVEMFFNFAHYNIVVILFKMLIALRHKVLSDYKCLQIALLFDILGLFNRTLGLKRVEKLLRNTEGFETISQPGFWEPIYFSPKFTTKLRVFTLWFSLRISRQKSFPENFAEQYVDLARKYIFNIKQIWEQNPDPISKERSVCQHQFILAILKSTSQIILESGQRELLLKLVADLPEKSLILPSESFAECLKSSSVFGKVRALVKCANCKNLEKLEKEFQKCSRCGLVFYCSKACQRNDWPNHKQLCKEIRKQN